MEGTYGVVLGNQQIGKIQVTRAGLYYRFYCLCKIPDKNMYRLGVTCEDGKADLGILVPMKDGFGLDTKLPVKRFTEGEPQFSLSVKQTGEGKFYPIYPEEPFLYIANLKDGFLSVQKGRPGLRLKEKSG